jgi:hypothetical protein
MKGKIDKFLGYFISKKLSVFIVASFFVGFGMIIVASFFVGFGMIESTEWVDVAVLYIGGQAVVDAVAKLRK